MKNKNRITTISISLPEKDVEALRERAQREDRSVSSVVRLALRRTAEQSELGESRVGAR